MLSRSPSDCRSLLLNLNLNLNRCLCSDCSDCSDCSVNIVSWLQPTDRQCQLLSCPGQLKTIVARSAFHLVLDISDSPMISPVELLGQIHVGNLCWRPVDLWRIVPCRPAQKFCLKHVSDDSIFKIFQHLVYPNLRPLEPEITLLEFFFCEIGKVGRSVNRCALIQTKYSNLHVCKG